MESERLQQLFGFLENSPGDAFISFAIAKEYEGLGNENKALEWYERLRTDLPAYVGTYYHLGKLYEEMEESETALTVYQAGIVVAKAQKDQHAASELMGAKLNLELEM